MWEQDRIIQDREEAWLKELEWGRGIGLRK
jgi:hypothetical protein